MTGAAVNHNERLKPIDVRASEATAFIPTPLHPRSEEYAERVFKRVVRPGVDGWTRAECLAAADAALIRVGPMSGEDIRAAKRLKIITRTGVGVDALDLGACKETGVVVTNRPGGNAAAVAELTLALALAVLRRVVEVNNRIRAGERVPSITALAPGLMGKSVGIVGMGEIAWATARLFLAFDCKVVTYSPTSEAGRWVDSEAAGARFAPLPHTRVSSLDELLAASDVVSLHCPLTPATRNLIGAREMALMRPGAVLINTSRGGMVDETALAASLASGHLGGAGLDVMATEPAFGDNLGSLRDMPNVVILPHLGGSVDSVTEAGGNDAVENAVNYLNGKGVRNRVC